MENVLLPGRLNLVPLPTAFAPDFNVQHCQCLPGRLGSPSNLLHLCSPLWCERSSGSMVSTGPCSCHRLSLQMCSRLCPHTWVLLCWGGPLRRWLFPADISEFWYPWSSSPELTPVLSGDSHGRPQSAVCLLKAKATQVLMHWKVHTSDKSRWKLFVKSSGQIKPMLITVCFLKFSKPQN